MSGKAPAFQFYPQDYLASARVAEMSLEEEGVYIRLLCYCWASGSIPADPERCARLAGKGCSIDTATFVQRAFNEHPTDKTRLVHDRLEIERENQRIRREQASIAGKKSAESRANTSNKTAKTSKSNERSTGVQPKVNTSSSSSSSSSLNNIGGRAPENRIPDSLNDNQCLAAAEKWFDYLDSKQLHDKSPRGNEIALEAWWGQMAKFGRDGFLEAVEFSMSRGKWNVELQENQNGRARKAEPKEWIEAVKAAKKFPDNWERRKQILDPDVFEALKLTGSKAVAFGNDFELKTLKELFESHLKDIRSGIKTSN